MTNTLDKLFKIFFSAAGFLLAAQVLQGMMVAQNQSPDFTLSILFTVGMLGGIGNLVAVCLIAHEDNKKESK
jgi:hypothetical protein